MPTKHEAIDLAKKAVAEGHAIRYSVTKEDVSVESQSGWQRIWPEDEEIVNITEGYDSLNHAHYI